MTGPRRVTQRNSRHATDGIGRLRRQRRRRHAITSMAAEWWQHMYMVSGRETGQAGPRVVITAPWSRRSCLGGVPSRVPPHTIVVPPSRSLQTERPLPQQQWWSQPQFSSVKMD